MQGNNTTKWALGLAFTAALAMAGWASMAVVATRNSMLMETLMEARESIKLNSLATTANQQDISIINAQYTLLTKTVNEGFAELKAQIKEIGR